MFVRCVCLIDFLQDVCEAGGKTFQAVFGARTPLIESFLIKRKLMGPCWVTVRNPKVGEVCFVCLCVKYKGAFVCVLSSHIFNTSVLTYR